MSMTKRQAGSLGGQTTVKKYGVDYMKELGKLGAKSFHKKYKYEKFGTSDFLIVDRETNIPLQKTLNGMALR